MHGFSFKFRGLTGSFTVRPVEQWVICRCPLHCCTPRCRATAALNTVKFVCVAPERQTGTCVNKESFERLPYIIQHTQSLRSRLSMVPVSYLLSFK